MIWCSSFATVWADSLLNFLHAFTSDHIKILLQYQAWISCMHIGLLLSLFDSSAWFGCHGAGQVLTMASCASPCGCRPGWPSVLTKSAFVASNGGDFTTTWQCWPLPRPPGIGEFLVLPVSSTCIDRGLYSLYLMVIVSMSYLPNNFLFLFVSWLLHFLITLIKI
jgi:hypothetical protein